MEKYKKNISCSDRRKNPYQPILTQGVISAYPDIRARTTVNRFRKLSAEIPSLDNFYNLLHPEIELNYQLPEKNNIKEL